MCGGSGGKLGGIGPGEEVSYMMQFCALSNNGGHCYRAAAMEPHSWFLSIQQSANILCNRLVSLKLKKCHLKHLLASLRHNTWANCRA